MTDIQEQPTELRGRGRPRVPEVVARDEAVYQALTPTPASVAQLAESTGNTKNATYLSLWRLRNQGRVALARDGSARTWSVVA